MDTPLAAAADTAVEKPVTGGFDEWRAQIQAARTEREKLTPVWKDNVNYRSGKPFKEGTVVTDRVAVPIDWSHTKAKEAGLFSQVPAVILEPDQDRFKPAVPIMQRELNDMLTKHVKVEVCMEESLADVINAAGLAVCKTGYLATFEDQQVPSMDVSILPPEVAMQMMQSGAIEMLTVPKRVDCRFYANRISPSQALWSPKFKGSDFDMSPWVGWDGSFSWAQALREFGASEERPNGLTEEMKSLVAGAPEFKDSLNEDQRQDRGTDADPEVSFTEIFYWAAQYDAAETKLEKIRRLVFINGIDEPVIDEDLKWQEWSEETESFIGLTKFPLRFLTLTYISDTAVPPSDSEMGRPQVDEKMRSRSQMILQRDRAQPMRWGNTNRVDPMVMESMRNGDYQQIIPVNGRGDDALGEVSRASYPKENWDFDRVTSEDLRESWQIGPNQSGSFSNAGRTAEESRIVQGGYATRQAKERAKVAKYFLGIAECIAGLMQLFHDGPKRLAATSPEDIQRVESAWDREKVSGAKFVFTIREDSQIKLDSQQRYQQLERFLNVSAKSGMVSVPEILSEMAQLSSLDPAKVIVKPNPTPPEPPNVSLRASGEDLRDPIAGPYIVALMQKGPNKVTPEDVEAAKQVLISSSSPPAPPPVQPTPPMGPGQQPGTAPQPPANMGPVDRVTKRVDEVGG